jgi:hypothetical protein
MQISVEIPFSPDVFIALKNEVPPEGIVVHVPQSKGQRDMMSFIVWDPITIEVGKSLGTLGTEGAIGLTVNWLYNSFKDASNRPKL